MLIVHQDVICEARVIGSTTGVALRGSGKYWQLPEQLRVGRWGMKSRSWTKHWIKNSYTDQETYIPCLMLIYVIPMEVTRIANRSVNPDLLEVDKWAIISRVARLMIANSQYFEVVSSQPLMEDNTSYSKPAKPMTGSYFCGHVGYDIPLTHQGRIRPLVLPFETRHGRTSVWSSCMVGGKNVNWQRPTDLY